MGSRFSYALSIGLLACLFVGSMVIRYRAHRETKDIVTLTAFSAILAVSVGLLFTYNYLRFGSLLDFGMRHQASNVFRDYFLAGNYFRYDHIPYNLWSFFFRIPELVPRFPFIVLPAFTIEVRSYQFLPYHLLYRNDLSVSIFYMMPLLTLMVYPVVNRLFIRPDRPMWNYGLVFFLFMLQVLPPAFTVATTARYYYDVFPLAFILAYIGALQLIELGRIAFLPIGLLAFLSLVLSFSLPVQAMTFATGAIGYVAPMLHFF